MNRTVLVAVLLAVSLVAKAQEAVNVVEADLGQLRGYLERGQVTSVELVEAYLQRIAAYDQQGPRLNSIIRTNPRALADAAALDAERSNGQTRGPLHGIPIVVKDNYNTTFMPTTGGSVALANFVPSGNATQVDLLLEAGAIILAKTNLHEFAYGITTVGSLQGQTRNPYDPRRVPGGSSGGTGAAVAASFGAFGLGSDTCGSIRIPAAFNNLVGLRPSKGLSSIYGVMPLSHTQDVAGPLARSLGDLATVLDIVSGYDGRDAATEIMREREPPEFSASLTGLDVSQLRLGRLDAYMARADNPTRTLIDGALAWYESEGAEIVDVEIPGLGALISRSGLIGHEFRIDLNQYLSLFLSRDIANLNDVVDLGLYHEAVAGVLTRSRASVHNEDDYAAAMAARTELRAAIEAVMAAENLDAIIYPPIAEVPVFIGNSQPGNNCSIAANSGLPALSLPVGFTGNGLPVSMEMLGGFLEDARLLAMAYPFEQANNSRRAPPTTPALEDGRAPAPVQLAVAFSVGNIMVNGELEIDLPSNILRYDMRSENSALHAAVLVIDGDQGFDLNDPVVVNLLGPASNSRSGEYFMSPAFRQAFLDRRVYLKVFGDGLDVAGEARNIRP